MLYVIVCATLIVDSLLVMAIGSVSRIHVDLIVHHMQQILNQERRIKENKGNSMEVKEKEDH